MVGYRLNPLYFCLVALALIGCGPTVARPPVAAAEAEAEDTETVAPHTEDSWMDDYDWGASGVGISVASHPDAYYIAEAATFDPLPLVPLFESLENLQASGSGVVRMLHYGDSHTAADFLTTAIRRRFQKRFGDAGRGFVFIGRPWRSYRMADVSHGASGMWGYQRYRPRLDDLEFDDRLGMGGVASIAFEAGASAYVGVSSDGFFNEQASVFDVFYLRQPGGGSFSVRTEGAAVEEISTASEEQESGFESLRVSKSARSFEVVARGDGPVRFFGAAIENDGPGVVYDALGINGAFFSTPLAWNSELVQQQVARRDPRLIVFMYGSNDAGLKGLDPVAYAWVVKRAIKKVIEGAPESACLLIGPPDRLRAPTPSYETSQLDWVIDVQSDAAYDLGCAFLDTRLLMGGKNSFNKWKKDELAQDDGVHLTIPGYRLLGQLIATKLLNAYDAYLAEKETSP